MSADPMVGVRLLLEAEIARQDSIHPEGFPPTRGGVRLALATVQDELDETFEAWRLERRGPEWAQVEHELVQTVAVGVRALRELRAVGGKRYDQSERGQGTNS